MFFTDLWLQLKSSARALLFSNYFSESGCLVRNAQPAMLFKVLSNVRQGGFFV